MGRHGRRTSQKGEYHIFDLLHLNTRTYADTHTHKLDKLICIKIRGKPLFGERNWKRRESTIFFAFLPLSVGWVSKLVDMDLRALFFFRSLIYLTDEKSRVSFIFSSYFVWYYTPKGKNLISRNCVINEIYLATAMLDKEFRLLKTH